MWLAPVPPTPSVVAASERMEAPRLPMHVVMGLSNPEWLDLGFDGRRGHLGYALSVGTVVLANDVTGSLRYFLSAEDGGPFIEAGTTLMQDAAISSQTPRDWNAMAFVGVGYQVALGRFVANLGVGLDPFAIPGSLNQPIFVSSTQSLPRVLLQTGFSL